MWYQRVEPEPSTGLLPAPVEAEFPVAITWLRLNAACALLLGEGGRVFVQPAPAGGLGGGGGGEVAELRWGHYAQHLSMHSAMACTALRHAHRRAQDVLQRRCPPWLNEACAACSVARRTIRSGGKLQPASPSAHRAARTPAEARMASPLPQCAPP